MTNIKNDATGYVIQIGHYRAAARARCFLAVRRLTSLPVT